MNATIHIIGQSKLGLLMLRRVHTLTFDVEVESSDKILKLKLVTM